MPILSTDFTDIDAAVTHLKAAELVALPTETVYGLGADACSDSAVAKIFALKGRPAFNPLIVHVTDSNMAKRYVEWNDQAETLAQLFWPGPLTLILPRRADCSIALLCSAGGDTLAIRCPAHPVMRAVLAQMDGGIAAPSANRSGRISPTAAAHVQDEFGDALMVLNGGQCTVGIESTVIDCTGVQYSVLRQGSITEQMLSDAGIELSAPFQETNFKSPGMLTSHYAPTTPLRLDATCVASDEALLAFGPPLQGAGHTLNLSESRDLVEAAANLFAHLRALDAGGYRAIAAMPIPMQAIGIAINDRLRRAAA